MPSVAVAPLAKRGSTLTEQAIIHGTHNAAIVRFVTDKASSKDWVPLGREPR